ncbi:hypothetical protein [Stutzerimonas nitrititolerans]|uniref:hypothetical protein n=1 Tax=Stutzerimonas nitrititolerans TaxID=2482751 RepID=UPI00289EF69D|nr:hypothetical protein [Stutzerimonas nitrititolerans]
MKYTLYTSQEGTIGSDSEVNLSFNVERDSAPINLSHFNGGIAKLYDGYSTQTTEYRIELTSYDPRRLILKNANVNELEIHPEFIRASDPKDPLNQLIEVPLKLNQNLSGYIIRNSNWGLK